MSTGFLKKPVLRPIEPAKTAIPPLEAGDHLDQRTFHERYESMPEGFRAELVGGIVIVPSPLRAEHSRAHVIVAGLLLMYELNCRGVLAGDNATIILSPDDEPQPDGCLFLMPECGGQTGVNSKGYYVGPPELLVEVAWSSESIDMNRKLRAYEQAGVREYVVVLLRSERVSWMVRRDQRFEELPAPADGVFRSVEFPGLWLDAPALLRGDPKRMVEVLQQGLATAEHQDFAQKVAALLHPPT